MPWRRQTRIDFEADEKKDAIINRLHAGGGADVIDLEYHLDQLGGQQQLRLLAVQRLDDGQGLHIASAKFHAVNTKSRVAFRYLGKINV